MTLSSQLPFQCGPHLDVKDEPMMAGLLASATTGREVSKSAMTWGQPPQACESPLCRVWEAFGRQPWN